MKKIIAILAMIALVSGAAFAEISVGGHFIGTVNVLQSDTSKATDGEIFGSAGFDRVRLEASGSDEDGKFGGWLRIGDEPGGGVLAGLAWWKPIDQFKLTIGGNPDGIFGKEGVTGWMFYQTVTDTGVAMGGENVWGWDLTNSAANYWDDGLAGLGALVKTRSAFYEGFGGNGLLLEIKPAEVFGINVALPYFDGGLVEDVFGALTVQFDVNLDFGNIALTYVGDANKTADDKKVTNGKVFLYAGIGAIENVALDIGLGVTLAGEEEGHPIAVGLGAKVDISETFGLKARVTATLGGDKNKNDGDTAFLFDLLPYFAINENMTVFVSVGLTMRLPENSDMDSGMGFHFNPYLQVGSEWGPKFLAGIKVWQIAASEKYYEPFNGDAFINWAVPIALNVSF